MIVRILTQVDISTLDADALEPFNANLWLLSPACQPYTVLNPRARGAADPRAHSFLHLIENVLPALVERGAAPTRLLVENVAGFEVRSFTPLSGLAGPDDLPGESRHPPREHVFSSSSRN